jgi:hypothetical protein
LLNTGTRFERNPLTLIDNLSFGPVAAYDADGDGAIDVVLSRGVRPTVVARNISPDINRSALVIEVVDASGRRNQFGRVVHVRTTNAPGVTMTRVVDSGSGILSQTPYPLTDPDSLPGHTPGRRTVRRRNVLVRDAAWHASPRVCERTHCALLSARESTPRLARGAI